MFNEGDITPEFCLPNEENENICINDFKGKWIVIYFYPKDNTPGCTTEACDFTANFDDFQNLDAEIIGISPDKPESHVKFIKKYQLKHILLSDPEHKILEQFGVWQLKKYMGKEYMGVQRSTFLVNPEGKFVKIWPQVSAKGHADEVKTVLEKLQS